MQGDVTRELLVSFLKRIKIDEVSHTGRSLFDHLVGTFDLLRQWKCEQSVCLAGGLHSVYGTNIFSHESLTEQARPLVQEIFGVPAERLAWLFSSIDRPKAIETGRGVNRRQNGRLILIEPDDLQSLRLIEAANLLEQGNSLEGWPNIHRAKQMQLSLQE